MKTVQSIPLLKSLESFPPRWSLLPPYRYDIGLYLRINMHSCFLLFSSFFPPSTSTHYHKLKCFCFAFHWCCSRTASYCVHKTEVISRNGPLAMVQTCEDDHNTVDWGMDLPNIIEWGSCFWVMYFVCLNHTLWAISITDRSVLTRYSESTHNF